MKDIRIDAATTLQPIEGDRVVIRQDDGTGIDETVELDRASAQALRDSLGAWLFAGHQSDPDKEDKVAVMLGDTQPPTVILAMGQAAWDYCKDGKTHLFDLTKAGLPFHIMIAGGPTRSAVIQDVERGVQSLGGTLDRGGENSDLTIDEPTKQ